jgi:hypothetical protein
MPCCGPPCSGGRFAQLAACTAARCVKITLKTWRPVPANASCHVAGYSVRNTSSLPSHLSMIANRRQFSCSGAHPNCSTSHGSSSAITPSFWSVPGKHASGLPIVATKSSRSSGVLNARQQSGSSCQPTNTSSYSDVPSAAALARV